jgi:hypothetical protein
MHVSVQSSAWHAAKQRIAASQSAEAAHARIWSHELDAIHI